MTNPAPERPKRGRPKKVVDLELVERLAHIQCTHAEIAAALNVSVDTLWRNKNFAEVYKRGSEGGRKSLRRMQFESANKGNVTMQIWLGKQYLCQSDHLTSEVHRVPSSRERTIDQLNNFIRALTPEELHEALESEMNSIGLPNGDKSAFASKETALLVSPRDAADSDDE